MKRLYGWTFALGLMVLMGTAGSSDLDLITGTQATVQCISGLLMVLIGFFGGKLWRTQ